jgi:hypothetical protein
MKHDPELTNRMMSGLMEASTCDTSMMSRICTSMMSGPELMDMMQEKDMMTKEVLK